MWYILYWQVTGQTCSCDLFVWSHNWSPVLMLSYYICIHRHSVVTCTGDSDALVTLLYFMFVVGGCLAGRLGGCIATFHVCCQWSPGWSPRWLHHYISCLFQQLPGWLLCLCIIWGDLVHTTKVSHHVCTLFLACPLPWMGHLVVRQEQARSPH